MRRAPPTRRRRRCAAVSIEGAPLRSPCPSGRGGGQPAAAGAEASVRGGPRQCASLSSSEPLPPIARLRGGSDAAAVAAQGAAPAATPFVHRGLRRRVVAGAGAALGAAAEAESVDGDAGAHWVERGQTRPPSPPLRGGGAAARAGRSRARAADSRLASVRAYAGAPATLWCSIRVRCDDGARGGRRTRRGRRARRAASAPTTAAARRRRRRADLRLSEEDQGARRLAAAAARRAGCRTVPERPGVRGAVAEGVGGSVVGRKPFDT